MASTEISLAAARSIRTVLVAAGLAIAYFSLLLSPGTLADGVFIFGLGLCTYGCYFWAKLKGRHWGWMLWGLAAPVGLLVLLLLKPNPSTQPPGA